MNDHDKNTARKREIVEVMEARKQTRSAKNFYKAQADEHRGELLAADIDRKIEGLKRPSPGSGWTGTTSTMFSGGAWNIWSAARRPRPFQR